MASTETSRPRGRTTTGEDRAGRVRWEELGVKAVSRASPLSRSAKKVVVVDNVLQATAGIAGDGFEFFEMPAATQPRPRQERLYLVRVGPSR